MPRLRMLELGVINITTHPHSPEKYISLFNKVTELGEQVPIRGSDWGMMAYDLSPIITDKPTEGLRGTFLKFLQINKNAPWLDTLRRQPIIKADGKPEPQVRDGVKPNFKPIEFIFYPKGHRFFFNVKHISPKNAQKFLENIFGNKEITKSFGDVNVIVESDPSTITKILALKQLKRLEIDFKLPNPDEGVDMDEIKQRMISSFEDQGIDSVSEVITSKTKDLKPGTTTEALMELAASNGKVQATAYEGNIKRTISTTNEPAIERFKYNAGEKTLGHAMINFSSQLLSKFTRRG